SLGNEYRGNSGKRDIGTGDVSERRGCAGCTNPFLEGAANGGGKASRVRGLSGKAAQESLNSLLSKYPLGDTRRPLRWPEAWSSPWLLALLLLGSALLSGCAHKHTPAPVPPPPSLPQEKDKPAATPPPAETETTAGNEKIQVPAGAKPIFEETGMASWYGAPYHNRRGSNGEVYNMHAMTAAHLTLPLGSIVRVTNLKTGNSALLRITDRGPFVPGRIVDLSLAAAKAVDVYLPGTARDRLEVLQAPAPLETGGRWAVQIGSFTQEKAAAELAKHLQN